MLIPALIAVFILGLLFYVNLLYALRRGLTIAGFCESVAAGLSTAVLFYFFT